MRWVLMLFVILAALMGGEARAVVVMGRVVMRERGGRAEAGEALAAWRGEPVAMLANRPEAETATWNLEVENEHVYRVGPAGILVHNDCPTPKELFEGGGGVKTTANTGAESVNHGATLRSKLSAFEDARAGAASTKTLPDGRVRYYGPETPARTPGPTRGASYVTEHNPATGGVRSWMESYDQAGNVNRVYPKMINGQQVDSQHYPPTAKELGE